MSRESIDSALASLQEAPVIVLDFHANSGARFDHPALMGRFVPKGETLAFAKPTGEHPSGGPLVAIIDITVRSAYCHSQRRWASLGDRRKAHSKDFLSKTTIDLPSKLFSPYVSVASNMKRSNGRKGLEGICLIPYEIIAFAPEDLAAGTSYVNHCRRNTFESFSPGQSLLQSAVSLC
ncbi:hypothetical protein OAN94_05500 [Verrucomicrobiales bacterium]|jgi:hypothetical protein|nr:hypothetical protein [Verrucomicrobiales bacterium]MDA7643806.1 hypothetical protein [Verrucomicrobiales bacterium]MDB4772597.1 hypothetical protein [Verrucomicrobiales bacterium]MDC0503712.1 hypothetical protein [Verrucomicrobiales bacterium]MDF1787062.1 hypothetical protein [Verrucomicrobiales bacterium]